MKKTFSITILAYAALAANQAFANETTVTENIDVKNQMYICERGVQLPVTFLNEKNGDSFAVVYVEGKLVPMKARPAASGVWYVALDEQDSYRLHTKGNEAFLAFMEADHTAKEQPILESCVADLPEE